MESKISGPFPRADGKQSSGAGFGQKLMSLLGFSKARGPIAPPNEPVPSPLEVATQHARALVKQLFADGHIEDRYNQQLFRLIGLAAKGKLESYKRGSLVDEIVMTQDGRTPVQARRWASDADKELVSELNEILANLGVFPHPDAVHEVIAGPPGPPRLPLQEAADRPDVPGGPRPD